MTNTIAIVLAALVEIESGGNPRAVGDGGRAVGLLQMWPVAVAEANRLESIEARREERPARTWTVADRTDPDASREMCAVTLRWHWRRGVTDPVDLGGRWRNPSGNAPEWYKARLRAALSACKRQRRHNAGVDRQEKGQT
jgi:hypothetical protein